MDSPCPVIPGAQHRRERRPDAPTRRALSLLAALLVAALAGFATDLAGASRDAAAVVGIATLAGLVAWQRARSRARRTQRRLDRLQAVYAASPTAIVETDVAGRIERTNHAFRELLGMSRPQLLGTPLLDLLHPSGPAFDAALLADLRKGLRASLRGAALLAHADGHPVPVRMDWAAVADRDGVAVGLTCVLTDQTTEMRVRAELQEARERAEAMFDRIPIGMIEGDATGTVLQVNEAFCRMLGYRADELVGTRATRLAAPQDSAAAQAGMQRLLRGEVYTAERTYLAADGREVPVVVSTMALHDASGRIARVAAYTMDVSETVAARRDLQRALQQVEAAQRELAARQAFTDALLETIDVGIVSCDADGTVLQRNRAARELLGLDETRALSSDAEVVPLVDVLDVTGERLPPERYPLAQVLADEDTGDVTILLGPAGGPHREVLARGSRIRGADEQLAGAVVALTDVTELHRLATRLDRQAQQLLEAQSVGQIGSWDLDPDTGEWHLSPELCRIWGYERPVTREQLLSRIHPEDVRGTADHLQQVMATGGRGDTTFRIRHAATGEERFIRTTMKVELDVAGRPVQVTGTHQDVTAIVRAERKASEASARFQAILAATPDFIFVIDLTTRAVLYAPPDKRIAGLTGQQLVDLGPDALFDLVHPDDQAAVLAVNEAAAELPDGETLQVRHRLRTPEGQWLWFSRHITPFRRDPSTGRATQVLGVTRDITGLVEAEEKLHHAALHDALTGLPNRVLLAQRLEAALARSETTGSDVELLFIDLDGFKRVNDVAGHAAGDQVLVLAATRMAAVLRPRDLLARVGGDEFVIVVEPRGRDEQDAAGDALVSGVELAERISAALREPFVVDGLEHVVTASIGMTSAGAGDGGRATAETVLSEADLAMYRAKRSGKDRVEVFEHQHRVDTAYLVHVERCLRRAVQSALEGARLAPAAVPTPRQQPSGCRLTVHFQPIVWARTGALTSFEALARLTDGEEVVDPEVFVAVAEETGLVHGLGLAVLDMALTQLVLWRRGTTQMDRCTVSVNVSALQIQHVGFTDTVRQRLRAHGLTARDLVLEVAETVLVEAAGTTLDALRELQSDGVGIAVDGFGTGYASLRALASLPISTVKVHRTLTADLGHDPLADKLVHAAIGLAAELGLSCVVEGVETPEQRLALPEHVQLQGYLTGAPLLASDIDELELLVGGVP